MGKKAKKSKEESKFKSRANKIFDDDFQIVRRF